MGAGATVFMFVPNGHCLVHVVMDEEVYTKNTKKIWIH